MIEKYVSNFELSKEMKELGFLQESEFYWIFQYNVDRWIVQNSATISFSSGGFDRAKMYSAYLVGELGEILPCIVIYENYICCFNEGKVGEMFSIRYTTIKKETEHFDYVNEANARAKMAIYLKRKGLI